MPYGLELIDYAQLPRNFDRYSADDQARMVVRMLAILKASREGVDLEANAPLLIEPISLEEGIKQLATLQG